MRSVSVVVTSSMNARWRSTQERLDAEEPVLRIVEWVRRDRHRLRRRRDRHWLRRGHDRMAVTPVRPVLPAALARPVLAAAPVRARARC